MVLEFKRKYTNSAASGMLHAHISTNPPEGGNIEEPSRKKLKSSHRQNTLTADETNGKPANCLTDFSANVKSGSSGQRRKELVIKALGISSTAFIGPVCRPKAVKSKTDIEDKLSEFYKELEQIESKDSLGDRTDGGANPAKSCKQNLPPREEKGYANHSRHYHGPRPHREHHSDPGNHWRWRPDFHHDMNWNGADPHNYQSQWQHPAPFGVPQGPPNPRFQFHRPPHYAPLPPRHPVYPPGFGPPVNCYEGHDDDGDWHPWESSQFPPGPGNPPHVGYRNTDGCQDYGMEPLPPDFENQRGSSQNPGWSQPCDQQYSDWHQHDPDPEPQQQYYHEEDQYQQPCPKSDSSLVLILMRGVPGSGKSTRAKELMSTGPNGTVLSSDDYYFQEDGYVFDPSMLGDAHDWNQNRARKAIFEGRSPVIIDNTNIQAWEMKPYVMMALERGYSVKFHEPDTSWKCDPSELEKRNKHGVPQGKIAKMLERFELPMNVDIVLNSLEPSHKSIEHLSKQHGRTHQTPKL